MREVKKNAMRLGKGIVTGVKNFWNDESGMGTVEVILIIVEIFTLHYIFFYDIVHNVVLNH
jgi:hypothetical protein